MNKDFSDVGTTLMYALNDTAAGHNVPSMPMGQTVDGTTILAKAVFADEKSAALMAEFLDKQAGQEGRFETVIVELWRPTDIEVYVRQRIRDEAKKSDKPKLILPGSM